MDADTVEQVEQQLPPAERGWHEVWQAPFLAALSRLPDVSAAARAAGIGRRATYSHRDKNPRFAEAWDDALAIAKDGIERIAWSWATTGVPVKARKTTTRTKTELHPDPDRRKKGETMVTSVTTETVETEASERNATLMIFMLKAHYPDRYRWIERVGIGGDADQTPIRLESVTELDRQIELLARELSERGHGEPVPDEQTRDLVE